MSSLQKAIRELGSGGSARGETALIGGKVFLSLRRVTLDHEPQLLCTAARREQKIRIPFFYGPT